MTLKETKLTKAGILLGKFAIIFLVLAQNVNAEIFFADDFEGGACCYVYVLPLGTEFLRP